MARLGLFTGDCSLTTAHRYDESSARLTYLGRRPVIGTVVDRGVEASYGWGIVPGTRNRFAFRDRWPGVLENKLRGLGQEVRVMEYCLNGRRTVLEDPAKPGRNGLVGLGQRIEIHSPLALVMILLGTNDFQAAHTFDAQQSANGLASLVDAVRNAPIEPGMPRPYILQISPPVIQPLGEVMRAKFAGAEKKAEGLGRAIHEVANTTNCHFFDAADVTTTSVIDGVHLDADQHRTLGEALAILVAEMLNLPAVFKPNES